MGIKKFKEYLANKDNQSLKNELLTLYKKFAVIQEYYVPKIEPQKWTEVAEKYRKILEKQFCPSKGFPQLKYSTARKAINDFKKVCQDPHAMIDMELVYVEYGVECTLEYGDIDEKFYDSMESMFEKCLEDMKEYQLLDVLGLCIQLCNLILYPQYPSHSIFIMER